MGLSNDALNPHGIALDHGTPQSPMCDSTPSDDARPPSASALDHAAPEQHTQNTPCPRPPLTPPAAHPGAQQAHLDVDENDCTPRSEVPSVPDALNTALLSHAHTVDPEPSYFSPQPLRIYSSPIPHSTPTSSNPSPSTSTHASQASLAANPDDAAAATAARSSAPPPPQQYPDRPAFMRDLSSASTASNTTVRANSVDPIYPYAAPPRQRDGPVYPNQSYAALHLQKYPQPYVPPIVRSRSSHPAHAAANSLSSLGAFGLTYDHFRDIMDSGPRTVGNSPVSTPGLFNPANRRMSQDTDATDDGTYSTPWLHHTHRQAPKETHIADVQADPVSGRKIVNQYEIIDELGRGVHGKVKLGKDLVHGRYVAIKIVDRYSKRRRLGKNNSHEDKIKREIAILKKARHPNIVSLLEVIDDPAKKKVYIVLEHVELGEVKWRTEGAKEICLVEWRRFKRESQGVFDNDSAAREDENIIRIAHQKLARQQRRAARAAHLRRKEDDSDLAWSLEMGMDSEDDYSENGRGSQSSSHTEELPRSQVHFRERQQDPGSYHDDHMETAFRSPEPNRDSWAAGLEGTMYGPYDSDFTRGRAPSLADSSSSRVTDPDEEIPEHFNYVPLMTTQAAWEAFKDTVLGIEYLHYQNVIHRDIKPANLLVTREHRIKISDFGVSYLGRQKTDEANGDQSETEQQEADEAIELAKTVGTPAFYAPELCRTETDAETPLIDGGIDIWALGVTLYCLIYGRVPFHDTNTFTLMKVISEDEPYIPRYRLKPVAEHSTSRPSSHGRNTQPVSSKRAPHDLEYEEVDENLRDLLRRLLVKDARHRITIPEIKRHPWVLSGIPNHISWAEETDPSRSFEGRKIQISKEDVDEAVVPIGFVDRLRFAAKKTSDFVKGFTTRSSGSRRRAQSSAANHDTPNISANSSSSTISQDARPQEGRRGSLAPGAILEILTRSRESEHPLSHSVTASPEARERSKYFDSPSSRTASPAQHTESYQRPPMQDRAVSSISTIRQSDMHGRSASPVISPALPGTPTALDTPGGSQLGGLFGGLPRRVVNSMRSRDRLKPPKEHSRARSIDRLVGCEEDGHAVPSLAISTTCASGQVNQPDVLKEASSPVARTASPANSEAQSFSNIDASSRQSSLSSMSSRLRRNWAAANDIEVGPSLGIASESRAVPHWPQPSSRRPSSTASVAQEQAEETFDRAKDEYRRRLGVEQSIARERSNSAAQRPPSSLSQAACPPSPDDEITFNQQSNQEYWHRNDQSSENSPLGGSSRGLALSSSEDQFSAMSQSESNPSIPSVASVGSPSQGPCASFDDDSWITSSTIRSFPSNEFESPADDASGYDGDHAVESDEDDDSEEEGLMMGFARKKVPAHKTNRSSSVSNGELARSAIHLGMNTRRRSNRSGSNGTVKKIPPPEPTPVHEQASESH